MDNIWNIEDPEELRGRAANLAAVLRKAVEWDKRRPAPAPENFAFYMEVPEWVREARAILAEEK